MRITLITAVALTVVASSMAFAGQPDRPGAFGRDRAAGVKSFQTEGSAPGSSEWGKIAAERGRTNGTMNREYKKANGGAPTKGAPTR